LNFVTIDRLTLRICLDCLVGSVLFRARTIVSRDY